MTQAAERFELSIDDIEGLVTGSQTAEEARGHLLAHASEIVDGVVPELDESIQSAAALGIGAGGLIAHMRRAPGGSEIKEEVVIDRLLLAAGARLREDRGAWVTKYWATEVANKAVGTDDSVRRRRVLNWVTRTYASTSLD